MQSLEALPDFPLCHADRISAQFLAAGITDFRAAARYLYRLPYGRNTNRADFRLVLTEGRGTCSTKHALLAQLAREQGAEVDLTLGIYEMTERNTPGVGTILETYSLPYLPEAHCYLRYQGKRVDITRAGVGPGQPIGPFLYEETITPEQIGEYKVELHQRFMREWAATTDVAGHRSWEELWHIREACIAALSE